MAGAWSLRPRPGAPVSTPMTWDQLADVADPREFNIHEVPDLVADGDPWAEIDDVAHSLEPLLRLWEELPGGELNFPPDYPKMPGEPPRASSPARRSQSTGTRKATASRREVPAFWVRLAGQDPARRTQMRRGGRVVRGRR